MDEHEQLRLTASASEERGAGWATTAVLCKRVGRRMRRPAGESRPLTSKRGRATMCIWHAPVRGPDQAAIHCCGAEPAVDSRADVFADVDELLRLVRRSRPLLEAHPRLPSPAACAPKLSETCRGWRSCAVSGRRAQFGIRPGQLIHIGQARARDDQSVGLRGQCCVSAVARELHAIVTRESCNASSPSHRETYEVIDHVNTV